MADSEDSLQISLEQGAGVRTNFTKTIHDTSYQAIDPTRPELSQEGRNVLITGGGTGVGLAIAKGFVQARAKTIIIAGRREDVLADAKKDIEQEAQKAGKATQVIAQKLDVTDKPGVAAFWSGLKDKGIEVHVLVLNSAKFSPAGSLFDIGSDVVWDMFEANVHGPLIMAEAFSKQGGDSPKSLVNVATQSIHAFEKSELHLAWQLPAYGLTKNAGALTIQQIASHTDPDKMQVVSFHPGLIYASGYELAGIPESALPFNDKSLPASSAVWLASPEARFLHGRFIWASWDVDELKTGEVRKKIDEDIAFLKVGVHGLKCGGNRDW